MKISVDFSIFGKTGQSLGHVSGEMEVSEAPRTGEFLELPRYAIIGKDIGLPSALRVEHVVQPSSSAGPYLIVALQSVTIEKVYSLDIMDRVIERKMGLYWNPHDLR